MRAPAAILLLAIHLVDDQAADLTRRIRNLAAKEEPAPRAATVHHLEEVLRGKPYVLPAPTVGPEAAPPLLYRLEHAEADPAGYDLLAGLVRRHGVPTGTDNPSVRARLALAELADLLRVDFDVDLPALRPLRGKPVIVIFWATWCGPCLTELPLAERLHQDGASVIAVTDDSDAVVRSFMAKRGYTFPVALDPSRRAFLRFGVTAMPSTRVLDASGRLRIQGGQLDEVVPRLAIVTE